eukprot:3583042-Pleurochrysis_carterae.AAC.1
MHPFRQPRSRFVTSTPVISSRMRLSSPARPFSLASRAVSSRRLRAAASGPPPPLPPTAPPPPSARSSRGAAAHTHTH